MEYAIHLDGEKKEPLYEQIYLYFQKEIKEGQLVSHEKMPSTRALASCLEVSRTTVEQAYEQLLAEGYIESIPYKGHFVADIKGLYHLHKEETIIQQAETPPKRWQYDFSPWGIDVSYFPVDTWKKLSREVLNEREGEVFSLGDPKGEWELRNAIRIYLHQARGVKCDAEQIILGAGNDYLVMVLMQILQGPRKIAFETPTYRQACHLFENLGCQIIPVRQDKKGMLASPLYDKEVDLAYVMPAHHFPLGTIMPLSRRLELLHWANETKGFIIEDDYDSEFRYRGKPIPALQGYDVSGRVIYLGTFSKAIAPAIRISYMVLPPELLKMYDATCGFLNCTVSRIDQLILTRFMEKGYFERHLNRMRAIYKGRHDLLMKQLQPLMKEGKVAVFGENAGVHLLVTVKGGQSEEEIIRRAQAEHIHLCGLSEFVIDEEKSPKETILLLGYALVETEDLETGVEKIKKILW